MNPLTSPIVIQKVLGSGANTIITCATGWRVSLSGITFNNPAPLTVTVSLFKASNSTTVDVYTFTLAAGDVVADNNSYNLYSGDQLIVTTSVAGTNFIGSGNYFKL